MAVAVPRGTPEEAFSASLYQMELDRLRYSLSKYLRTRLRKVERDAMHVLSVGEEEMEGRLSDRYLCVCSFVCVVLYCDEMGIPENRARNRVLDMR